MIRLREEASREVNWFRPVRCVSHLTNTLRGNNERLKRNILSLSMYNRRLVVNQLTLPAPVVRSNDYRDRDLHVLERGKERMRDAALPDEGL